MSSHYTYLALGDSYTIGENVALHESYPYRLIQLLRSAGKDFAPAEIIARTGWTTDELQAQISQTRFLPSYDLVSLLIGVNNQYRGRSLDEYADQFERLLQQAISFAADQPSHVIVLSIPDWGITPFAQGRDREKISWEIDAYNACNRTIALRYKVHYTDITPGTREAAADNSLLAADGLHPSGKEYARWAAQVLKIVLMK